MFYAPGIAVVLTILLSNQAQAKEEDPTLWLDLNFPADYMEMRLLTSAKSGWGVWPGFKFDNFEGPTSYGIGGPPNATQVYSVEAFGTDHSKPTKTATCVAGFMPKVTGDPACTRQFHFQPKQTHMVSKVLSDGAYVTCTSTGLPSTAHTPTVLTLTYDTTTWDTEVKMSLTATTYKTITLW